MILPHLYLQYAKREVGKTIIYQKNILSICSSWFLVHSVWVRKKRVLLDVSGMYIYKMLMF